jgi:hypothetical protein
MANITVGDSVLHRDSWGLAVPTQTQIVSMDLCATKGQKHGVNVDFVDDAVKDRLCVVLANGKWAYGYQIDPILDAKEK